MDAARADIVVAGVVVGIVLSGCLIFSIIRIIMYPPWRARQLSDHEV